jgi:hypothetical protein
VLSRITFVVIASAAIAFAQTALTTAQIAKRVSPSVVVIQGKTDSGDVLGSGFIVSNDGKIVTNLHVIRDMKAVTVRTATGEIFDSVAVLATDERRDLAIVKVAGFNLPMLDLGDSESLSVGESVVIVGSPSGLEGTVTAGILSSVRDSGEGFKILQTDAAVNPGNSGGPLVNIKGQAIGVVSFKLRSMEGLNFGVPINYVRGLLNSMHEPVSLEQLQRSLASNASVVQQNSGPSLKETLDWLSGTIPLGAYNFEFSYVLSNHRLTMKVNRHNAVWSVRGCTVQTGFVSDDAISELPTSDSHEMTAKYTVPLGMLNGWSVQRQDNTDVLTKYFTDATFVAGERWSYAVLLSSSSKNIYFVVAAADPRITGSVKSVDTLSLNFNDESIAQRVATAFHHASDLCRDKEPF